MVNNVFQNIKTSKKRQKKMEIPLVNIADSDVKLLCEDGTRPADSSNAAADAFDVQEEECWGGTTCAVSQGFTVVGVMQVDPLEKKNIMSVC